MKVNRKKCNYEIVRLENEVVNFELFLEWSRDNYMTKMIM
jgi:hypothetical protein